MTCFKSLLLTHTFGIIPPKTAYFEDIHLLKTTVKAG